MNLETLGLAGLFIGTFLAATIFPFSSDALYIGILAAGTDPISTLVVGTMGNWAGGVTTYYIGRLGKWEWIEKYFKVSQDKLLKQKNLVDRYGVWLALISWVPVIGDIAVLALGFFKSPALWTMVLMLIGKALRFAVWTAVLV